MKKLLISAGIALLGTAATLLWWTYSGTGSNIKSSSHIPAKIAAGGNQLEVFAEASTPSTMRISFSDLRKSAGSQILLEPWEQMPAGSRSWTIDVPSGIGGYIELGADHPNAGDTLTVRVKLNGKNVDHQTDKLQSALEPNTAFFVQFHYDDYSKATSDSENSASENDKSSSE